MLTPVDAGLWIGEGPIVSFFGFAYPTRMVLARLPDGGVWVWSPVRLTAKLRAEVDALGPVAHLVCPNKLHHLFLGEWHAAYPDAAIWGPASAIARHRGIAFTGPLEDAPPAGWQGVFEQVWFRGSFAMDEIVFFHRPSRTVIVADLVEAFDPAFVRAHWAGWLVPCARWGGILADDPKAPIDWRLSFWRRDLARAARARMLAWNCERVIMAHGLWQPADGRAYLARALRWLGRG